VETHQVKASPPAPYNQELVDGDMIRDDDVNMIIAAQGLTWTPAIGWAVTIDAVAFKIMSVKKFYSGASVAAYEMQLRR
jgi:hypothetical protein